MCKSLKCETTSSAVDLASSECAYNSLNCTIQVKVNEIDTEALIDSGSGVSFIDKKFYGTLSLPKQNKTIPVRLASKAKIMITEGICKSTLVIYERKYNDVEFNILDSLCNPIILGRDFLSLHKSVKLNFDGSQEAR